MAERLHGDPAEVVRAIPGWDRAQTEAALSAMHRARRRRRAIAWAAPIALAAAAVALVALWPSSPGAIQLADGSRFVPIDGEVRVEEVSAHEVRLSLARGGVDADVVHDASRRVSIDAGAVRVTVLGTAFRVRRGTDEVDVEVRRGRVAVTWPGGRRELAAGEHGVFAQHVATSATPTPSPSPGEASPRADEVTATRDAPATDPSATPPSAAPRRSAHAADPAAPTTGTPSTTATTTTPAPAPTEPEAPRAWRSLAQDGDFAAAYAELDAEGPGSVHDEVGDLLLAADAARLSGHPSAALPYLERAEHLGPSDPRAALVTFTAGRILAQLGRARDAAAEFDRTIAREPHGSLAEDATARSAEAHLQAGERARAADIARDYLATHPEGRWRARMQALLDAAP